MASLQSRDIIELEKKKFFEDENGNIGVNTGGQFTILPSGLKNGGKVTKVTLNDSEWLPIPPLPLLKRNTIGIQSGSNDILLNYIDTAPNDEGVKVQAAFERQYDITDQIIIYGRCISGTTSIIVEEIS